jgi:hypothetical protein
MMADMRCFPFGRVPAGRPPCGENIIDEHDPMPDKTMIADLHQFANKGMGLHLAKITDPRIALYLYKGTDKAVIPDPATIEVHRLYDGHFFSKYGIRCYARLFYAGIHNCLVLE